MITDKDPIHYIRKRKRLAMQILKLLNEYHDKNRYLAFNKRKRKFVLKKFR